MNSRNPGAAPQPGMAFGVDPSRSERYSLRQARYHEIGNFLAERGRAAAATGQVLKVLDIGAGPGLTLRHLEMQAGAEAIELYGADIKAFERLYRPEVWKHYWVGDLMAGLPMIPSEMFDIVLCEQVLEHLSEQKVAMATPQQRIAAGENPRLPHNFGRNPEAARESRMVVPSQSPHWSDRPGTLHGDSGDRPKADKRRETALRNGLQILKTIVAENLRVF